jgi:hypothetical protein
MPYCNLNEDTVVEHAKLIFEKSVALNAREDLGDLYRQMHTWDRRALRGVFDRTAATGKFFFKARIIGHGNNRLDGKNENAVIEQAVEFSVLACNDELFSIASNNKYLYCASAGAETVEGTAAQALGIQAAVKLYTDKLAARGYVFDRCLIDEWEYQGRSVEEYTRYEIAYRHDGGEGTIILIGYGNRIILCTNPYGVSGEVPAPATKKKCKWWKIVLGIVIVACVAAAAVCITLWLKK